MTFFFSSFGAMTFKDEGTQIRYKGPGDMRLWMHTSFFFFFFFFFFCFTFFFSFFCFFGFSFFFTIKIFLFSFFFFFFFYLVPHILPDYYAGWDLQFMVHRNSCSQHQCLNCSLVFLSFFSFLFLFFFAPHCGMLKCPAQGLNPSRSSNSSCCSDNTGSLTCCATRDLSELIFKGIHLRFPNSGVPLWLCSNKPKQHL